MKRSLKPGTWPVFTIALGSLLALLFLPGIAALRRSGEIYREIRRIQEQQRATQRSLAEIERRLYSVSIAVREALLDTSPVGSEQYAQVLKQGRTVINAELATLRRRSTDISGDLFLQLQSELDSYWQHVEPVFSWTPQERATRGTYFLRKQQRPRRQDILAIAEAISGIAETSYQEHYEALVQSQRQFQNDIERIVALAFLIGVLIAAASIFRISTLEDRSARERERVEAAQEQLRSLSMRLMQAQEEERKSISRELHDEVGQLLTALRMQVSALDKSRHDEAAFAEHLTEARSLAEQAVRSVRDLAVGLRPSVLDLGLVPALQWQARRFSKLTGLRVSVNAEGELPDIPEDRRTCVYRVVQESLTNAAKHSRATAVNVSVHTEDGRLHVRVQDDGSGHRPTPAEVGTGIGLIGMQERVRELGGTLHLEFSEGKGTAVVAELDCA